MVFASACDWDGDWDVETLDVGVGVVETGVDSELEARTEVVGAVDVETCVTVEEGAEDGVEDSGTEVC